MPDEQGFDPLLGQIAISALGMLDEAAALEEPPIGVHHLDLAFLIILWENSLRLLVKNERFFLISRPHLGDPRWRFVFLDSLSVPRARAIFGGHPSSGWHRLLKADFLFRSSHPLGKS